MPMLYWCCIGFNLVHFFANLILDMLCCVIFFNSISPLTLIQNKSYRLHYGVQAA